MSGRAISAVTQMAMLLTMLKIKNPLVIYRKPKVGTERYASVRFSQGVFWELESLVFHRISFGFP